MKIVRNIFTAILAALILAACTSAEPEVIEPGILETDYTVNQPGDSEELPETGPGCCLPEDDGTVYITEEEIDTLMQAYLLHEKFTVYSSDSIIGVPPGSEDSLVIEIPITEEYTKVCTPEYDTWDEWTAFIESIYWGEELMEVTERMENDAMYISRDGYTYVRPGGMGWYVSQDYTAEVLSSSVNFAQVKITRQETEVGTDNKTDYVRHFYLQKNDGRWRISDITLPE